MAKTPSRSTLIQTLARIDLNLLIALDALLRERSVTRAANMLGLSQPALSASLSRLRRYFDDELLVRVGNNYELTPLAVLLADRTTAAMSALGHVFAAQIDFEPATSRREFDLYLSDYAASVLAVPLGRLIRAESADVRLRIQQLRPGIVDDAANVLRDHDGIVVPHGFIDNMRYMDLFTDQFVCLVSSENPAAQDGISVEDMLKMPMVVAFKEPTGGLTAMHELRMAGLEPNIDTVTESFLIVPFLVAGTDRISLVPSLLVQSFARMAEVTAVPCPYPVADLVDTLWWHPTYDNDPGHRWFRDLMRRAATTAKKESRADR